MVRTSSSSALSALDVERTGLPAMATPEELASLRTDPAHPHWNEIPGNIRQRWLAQTVYTLMFTLKGKGDTEEQCVMIARMLDNEMMEDMYLSDLTMPEIIQAFRDGIFGKYGEYYGINAPSLHQFLYGYLQTPKKREAARLIRIRRGIEKDLSKDLEWVAKKNAESMARAMKERMEQENKEKKQE